MKFTQQEDRIVEGVTDLTNRFVSENGLIEVGIYPVIFGFRVRAGFVGDPCCILDWCAGSSPYIALSYALTILSKREENQSAFEGIPSFSQIKPMWNDEDFMIKIKQLCNETHTADQKETDLSEPTTDEGFQESRREQGEHEENSPETCQQEAGGVAEAIQGSKEATSGSCGVRGLQGDGPMG